MFQHTQTTTEPRTDRLTTIKRLATITLALAVAISVLVIGSGAAAAHPDHSVDETDEEGPGKYMGPDYEHGVEDHGYAPAHGVQEGQLSDGYGGYLGGV